MEAGERIIRPISRMKDKRNTESHLASAYAEEWNKKQVCEVVPPFGTKGQSFSIQDWVDGYPLWYQKTVLW